MSPVRTARSVAPWVAGIAIGVVATAALRSPGQATHPHTPEDPPGRALDANLYMQTAAEYCACCYQAYHLAAARLRQKVCEYAAAGGAPGTAAVVLDLDETVFDNGGFQTQLVRNRWGYDQRLWDDWEKRPDAVRLVPGAKEFIDAAVAQNVAVVYISNRSDGNRAFTKQALTRLGLPLPAESRLKLATAQTRSDKTTRRDDARKEFAVLLWVGDNLRDFDDKAFQSAVDNTKAATRTTDPVKLDAAVAGRINAVDRERAHFGDDWVILPNPAYGEWTKPLGLGAADADRLKPAP